MQSLVLDFKTEISIKPGRQQDSENILTHAADAMLQTTASAGNHE